MNRTRKQLIARGAAIVAVVVIAGVAVALWGSTGSGSGTATVTQAVDAVIAPSDRVADLYPALVEGDVSFTVTNDNAYPILYQSMVPGDITSSDEVACPAANVTVEGVTGLTLTSPPNVTTAPLSIADVVSMDIDAPDGCQDVSFEVGLVLTGVPVE